MKKLAFPLLCMTASIIVSICDFINASKDIDMDEKIRNEVSRQLSTSEDPE